MRTLDTQYNLEYYGGGADQTGGRTAGWSDYDCFLVNGSQVAHFPGDGAVEVILSVRAFKNTASAAPAPVFRQEDAGAGYYTARQTLTVCWK
jgi:hypothetical protein